MADTDTISWDWLQLTDEDNKKRRILLPITASPFIIGRSESDYDIPNPEISRHHVQLTYVASSWHIQDLESTNGSSLNGNRLDSTPQELRHGDVIALARAIDIQYHSRQGYQTEPNTLRTPTTHDGPQKTRLVVIDESSRNVFVAGRALTPKLSTMQFNLLKLLASRAGTAISKDTIAETIWPTDYIAGNDEIKSMVYKIRKRLNDAHPGAGKLINVIVDFGYVFSE